MSLQVDGRGMLLIKCFLCVLCCLETSLANYTSYYFVSDYDYDDIRIINGEDVPQGKYPMQVSLQNIRGQHVCGGTILNSAFVLTAGHCVADKAISPNHIRVLTSTVDLTKKGRYYRVAKIIRHHGFYEGFTAKGDKLVENDIALLKTFPKFSLNNGEAAVKLPPRGLQLGNGQLATVIGWGDTANGSRPPILQEVTMRLMGDHECDKTYYNGREVMRPIQHVCAVVAGRGACMGDSGGPLFLLTGEQVGIVSFGVLPCGSGPVIFAEVVTYLDWIEKNVAS